MAHDIAQTVNLANVVGFNVTQNSLERLQIAVYVAENGLHA
jgi:hypothetical protein